MTLNKAIKHAEEVADKKKREKQKWDPCDNAISREDALMALTGEWAEVTDEIIHRFIKRMKSLPSVNPQPKIGHWIPVSERLPEKEMNCLVTDSLGKVHEATFYHALDGRKSYFSGCYCVRAWMSLPKPYVPDTNIGDKSEIPTDSNGVELQESEEV